jgi:hypothetical protein
MASGAPSISTLVENCFLEEALWLFPGNPQRRPEQRTLCFERHGLRTQLNVIALMG